MVAAPAFAPPTVGAAVAPVAGSDDDYQTPWDTLDAAAGPLRVARTFDPGIKTPERWRSIVGPSPFYSVKPPGGDVDGFIAGRYTDRYQAMAAALPAGARLAVYHEPEDNLSGLKFLALTERAVGDLRAVRTADEVAFWYVAMAYQYRTNRSGMALTSGGQLQPGWLDAAQLCDGVGLDVYAAGPNSSMPIRTDPGAQIWLDLLVGMAIRPWGIVERGIYAHPGRIKMLFDDWRFCCDHGAVLFLYWQAQLQQYAYPLTEPAELAAFGRIASQGRARLAA